MTRRRSAQSWIQHRPSSRSTTPPWKATVRYVDGTSESERFELKRDAQQWADERTSASQPATTAVRTTVREAWDARMRAATRLARTTRHDYEATFERWIGPKIGDARMRDLTAEDLEAWIDWIRGNGGSEATAAKALRYVRPVFRRAWQRGSIRVNPTAGLAGQIRHVQRTLPSLTVAELDALIDAVRLRRRAIVVVLGYVGLRPGEVVALLVGDFDPKAGTLRVSKHATSVGGTAQVVERATKSGHDRVVPLEPYVVDELVAHLERTYGVGWRFRREALLFPSSTGPVRGQQMITPPSLRRELQTLAKSIGIRHPDDPSQPFAPYWLRHTAARHAIAAGFDPVVVARMLGHAKPSITLDRYAIWYHARDAAGDMARLTAYRDASRAL